jgi:protoporphyrinogen oxidase
MGYFIGGSKTLIAALEKSILGAGGKIFLGTEIISLERSMGRFLVASRNEQRNGYDGVVLSIPLPRAARLVQPLDPAYARKLSSIEFIGVVCGLFRLRKPVSGAFWLNINDPRLPANGLIEYTNLNPMPEIVSDHIVYIPLYVPENHPWYSRDESSLKQEFFQILNTINPELSKEDIIGFRSFRDPYAQAICPIGFKAKAPALATPIPGLFLLDSTQLYPSDRALSGLIGLAETMNQKYL